MQVIAWLLKIIIFIALLGFALGNTETVRVGVFGNQDIGFDGPLVLFLLLFFLAGLVIGLLAMLPRVLRHKREASRLRRELERLRQQTDRQIVHPDEAGLIGTSARLPSS